MGKDNVFGISHLNFTEIMLQSNLYMMHFTRAEGAGGNALHWGRHWRSVTQVEST